MTEPSGKQDFSECRVWSSRLEAPRRRISCCIFWGLRGPHPRRQQRKCAVALTDDQMLRPGESLAVHYRDRLTEAGMEWVVDDHLTRQTPGIVTLPRPAGARAILRQRSAWLSF